jgi:hypothetical protein
MRANVTDVFVFIYENTVMKPVEIILRKGKDR